MLSYAQMQPVPAEPLQWPTAQKSRMPVHSEVWRKNKA